MISKVNGKPRWSGKTQKLLLAIPIGESMFIKNHRLKGQITKTILTFGNVHLFKIQGSHVYRIK